MYEGFFGLSKRPFSAVPNPDAFVALESFQNVLDDILICVVNGRGIAVVTSYAGLGKTLLCKKIAESTDSLFQALFLSTSAFSTRRALLQAILYEFGIEYEGLTEQEARLKILEAARAIASEQRLLLIIVDEAHLLNSRLFEELRTLSDYAPAGEALIRLVFSGQYELEEKLADPAMSAIHQRIGCQLTLQPLSLDESAILLKERLRWAGAKNIGEILTPGAQEAICRASDGNPRCLCQLADHSLLLAFAEEQKPVERETVLAALEDLKELPLHWNDLSEETATSSNVSLHPLTDVIEEPEYSADFETAEFEIPNHMQQDSKGPVIIRLNPDNVPGDDVLLDEARFDQSGSPNHGFDVDETEVEYSVFEVGAEMIAESSEIPISTEFDSVSPNPVTSHIDFDAVEPIPHIQRELLSQQELRHSNMRLDARNAQERALEARKSASHTIRQVSGENELIEVPVLDKYAQLDRLAELPTDRQAEFKPVESIPPAAHPAENLRTSASVETDSLGLPAAWDELIEDAEDILLERRFLSAEAVDEKEILETVEDLRREIGSAVESSRKRIGNRQMDHDFDDWLKLDVVEPEIEGDALAQPDKSPVSLVNQTTDPGINDAVEFSEQTIQQTPETQHAEPNHRFAQLFTRLSQRRKKIKQQRSTS